MESVVSSVVERLVGAVERNVDGEQRTTQKLLDESNPLKTRRRGQNKRRQYTASFKSDVIQEYEAGVKAEDIAVQFNINRSLVLKWYKDRTVIMKAATSEHKTHLKILYALLANTLIFMLLFW